MIHNVVCGVCSVLFGASVLLAFLSFIAMITGVFRCAASRRVGISYFSAMASRNILFRPELYTDAASASRKLHQLGLAGTILFPILAIAAGSVLRWIGQS